MQGKNTFVYSFLITNITIHSSSSSFIHELLFGCDGIFPGCNYLRQLQIFREVVLHIKRDFYFFTVHVGTDHQLQTVRKKIFILIHYITFTLLLLYPNKNTHSDFWHKQKGQMMGHYSDVAMYKQGRYEDSKICRIFPNKISTWTKTIFKNSFACVHYRSGF